MASRAILQWKCEALTPIWTGNVDGLCAEELLESSVIGSMRWWLEAWARGAGWAVPDPIDAHPIYTHESRFDLDIVSRIFGATGWRRRFRLVTSGARLDSIPAKIEVKTGTPRLHRGGKSDWHYKEGRALVGEFALQLEQTVPWDPDYDATSIPLLIDLLAFMAKYGTIGAKPQLGLGVFRIIQAPALPSDAPEKPLLYWLTSARDRRAKLAHPEDLPSMNRFRFGEAPCSPPTSREAAWQETFARKANLRNKMRGTGKLKAEKDVRHALMGTTSGEPTRAKLILSHPFPGPEAETFLRRAWGWIPESLLKEFDSLRLEEPVKWPDCGPLPEVMQDEFAVELNRHPDWDALTQIPYAIR